MLYAKYLSRSNGLTLTYLLELQQRARFYKLTCISLSFCILSASIMICSKVTSRQSHLVSSSISIADVSYKLISSAVSSSKKNTL